ncbi:MAG: dihydroorotate dehydrogenase [Candidatus Nealsonbacteria bacterium]
MLTVTPMYNFFHKTISAPFTIPSGIVTTEVSVIEKFANEIPELGIITTKSIGIKSCEGNKEPIIAQYAPLSFINAVGLTNPGAKEFAERLSKISIPNDKFLLTSVFGNCEKELKEISEILYNYSNGFELNISCPHSKEYGQVVGRDKELVERLTKSIASLGKPVFVKISPNLDVKETIKYAIRGGASGITAINTKGPETCLHDSYSILSNKVGGISGKAILEIGLKCVREVRKITNLPIISCGGISTIKDIKRYKEAGANFFGIGSALVGMNTEEIKRYFYELLLDLENGTNNAEGFLKDTKMEYKRYRVKENKQIAEDLFILKLDRGINVEPGQFIFVWLPEKGEKPFSVFDDEPLTLLVKKRGYFTNELLNLKKDDVIYTRGPYGTSPKIKGETLLVGGGTGIAALYLFGKRNKNMIALLGAKDKNHLPDLEKFKKVFDEVYFVTENGRIGYKGLATDVLEEIIKNTQPEYCINCGPKPMVKAAIQKESKYINPEKIYSAIDFLTKCGIGLCGSCATSKGYRSCVDGNFLKPHQI